MTSEGFGPPLAFECLLQFCVQETRAEFRNGTLNETLVSTWTNNTQVSPGQINLPDADTILQPPNSRDKFIATALAVSGTSSWLSSLVSGNAATGAYSTLIDLDFVDTSEGLVQPFLTAMNKSATGVADMMDNLASSLSRSLRTIIYQPPPVNGFAFSSTTCATVRWPWLTLPFFLLIASLEFLIFRSWWKQGEKVWCLGPITYWRHCFTALTSDPVAIRSSRLRVLWKMRLERF